MQNEKEKFKNEFKTRLYGWTLQLLRFIDELPKDDTSRVLSNQLIRSGTGVISNYVEAHSSNSKRDFSHYFRIALRSANESKVWLILLKDMNRGNKEVIDNLLKELREMAAILASSLITMKEKRKE